MQIPSSSLRLRLLFVASKVTPERRSLLDFLEGEKRERRTSWRRKRDNIKNPQPRKEEGKDCWAEGNFSFFSSGHLKCLNQDKRRGAKRTVHFESNCCFFFFLDSFLEEEKIWEKREEGRRTTTSKKKNARQLGLKSCTSTGSTSDAGSSISSAQRKRSWSLFLTVSSLDSLSPAHHQPSFLFFGRETRREKRNRTREEERFRTLNSGRV